MPAPGEFDLMRAAAAHRCTSGTTMNAVGKLTTKPSNHPFNHAGGKERLNPTLVSTMTADTTPLMAAEISAAATRSIHREDRIATTGRLLAQL
jgi:uncharacterized protein (DUF2345 family)